MQQDYNIWFGQRLKEIMDERGITAKALEEMSGVGRMTISRIIKGRYATAEEVKLLADGLELSTERLKQKDYDLDAIKRRIEEQNGLEELEADLQHHLLKALGETERGALHSQLGRVYLCLSELHRAKEEWQMAYRFLKDHPNQELQGIAYLNLMIGYALLSDHGTVLALSDEAEPIFQGDLTLMARLADLKGAALVQEKRYEEAFGNFQKAGELYLHAGEEKMAGSAFQNMGHVKFCMGELEQAEMYYSQVYRNSIFWKSNRYYEMLTIKDYAKILLCMGKNEEALSLLESIMEDARRLDKPLFTARCLFLYALLKPDYAALEEILTLPVPDEKLTLAVKLLIPLLRKKDFQLHLELPFLRRVILEDLLLEDKKI